MNYVQAGLRLHQYLVKTHWNDPFLIGPDPGIRFNYRLGRFVKSYLPILSWHDELYYLQGQGYWVLANWRFFAWTGEESYRDLALRCAEGILARQRADGAWEYPNPEWHGRVATVEGIWASLGLLESYRHTANADYLASVLRWHEFLVEQIGFQQNGDELAVNYFANRQGERVPNNSADALRFFAELSDATGDPAYLQRCSGLITFIQRAQKPTGEFPYTVEGATGGSGRPHFQCYQYNAFQCIGLLRYFELTGDARVEPILVKALDFLSEGMAADGHVYYECGNRYRTVYYHTAALAAAFAQADALDIGRYRDRAERTYAYLLNLQQPDGGFRYSHGDYHILSDRRSYPRYLAMILLHLLMGEAAMGEAAMGEAAMGEAAQRQARAPREKIYDAEQ